MSSSLSGSTTTVPVRGSHPSCSSTTLPPDLARSRRPVVRNPAASCGPPPVAGSRCSATPGTSRCSGRALSTTARGRRSTPCASWTACPRPTALAYSSSSQNVPSSTAPAATRGGSRAAQGDEAAGRTGGRSRCASQPPQVATSTAATRTSGTSHCCSCSRAAAVSTAPGRDGSPAASTRPTHAAAVQIAPRATRAAAAAARSRRPGTRQAGACSPARTWLCSHPATSSRPRATSSGR